MRKPAPLIDDKLYTVTTINGYRVGNLTKAQASSHAGRLFERMKIAGWAGKIRILYRDGSVVDTLKVGNV